MNEDIWAELSTALERQRQILVETMRIIDKALEVETKLKSTRHEQN